MFAQWHDGSPQFHAEWRVSVAPSRNPNCFARRRGRTDVNAFLFNFDIQIIKD